MSDPTELLSTIVEFSVGLAGFSGLVGAFMHRSGKWLYVDQFRITNLLLMSLTPGFLAFLTLGLIQVSDSAIELSAVAFATALALLLILIPRARAKVPARDQHLVGLHIFIPIASTFGVLLVVQTLLAISVISSNAFIIYYFSLVVMLLLAVVQFARLILARPDASPAQTEDDA